MDREITVTLPERDVAKNWQGRLVVDQDGQRLGECTGMFADAVTGATEWLEVAVEGQQRCLVPALNAMEVDGQVRVAFLHAAVLSAPRVGDDTELSKRDDIVLYRHYGVHYSASTSPSLLPTEANLDDPGTAELTVPPAATVAEDAKARTVPAPPAAASTGPSSPVQEVAAEADTRPHVVVTPAPVHRPAPTAARSTESVSVTPEPPGPAASDEASEPPTPSAPPPTVAEGPPAAAPRPTPAPVRPPAPVHAEKPARTVPVTPNRSSESAVAAAPGDAAPKRSVPSQEVRPIATEPSPAGSDVDSQEPLATALAVGAPLAALAGLAAAVALGLRARDLRAGKRPARVSVARRRRAPVSLARRRRALVSVARRRSASVRSRPAPAVHGTSGRAVVPGIRRASAGLAQRRGRVGKRFRRQLWDLARVSVFGAGYLLGARAGRQRYDQILELANKFAQHPQVEAASQSVTGPPPSEQEPTTAAPSTPA